MDVALSVKKFQELVLSGMKDTIEDCEKNNEEFDWLLELYCGTIIFNYLYFSMDCRNHISLDGVKGLCGTPVVVKVGVHGEIWYCDKCLRYKT